MPHPVWDWNIPATVSLGTQIQFQGFHWNLNLSLKVQEPGLGVENRDLAAPALYSYKIPSVAMEVPQPGGDPSGKKGLLGVPGLGRVISIRRNGFDGFMAFLGLGMLTSSTRKAFPARCSRSSGSCNFPTLSTSPVSVQLDVSHGIKHPGVRELQELGSPSLKEGFAQEVGIRQCPNSQHSPGTGSEAPGSIW